MMLKYFVSRQAGIPITEQKILNKGRILTDMKTMLECGITESSKLHVNPDSSFKIEQSLTDPNISAEKSKMIKQEVVKTIAEMSLDELNTLARSF